MGRRNPDDRYCTMRLARELHADLQDYCDAYRRRTGDRLTLMAALEAAWDHYKRSVDPTAPPPITLRDGEERKTITLILASLREMPETQRNAVTTVMLRMLSASPVGAASEMLTSPPAKRKSGR